MSTVIDEDRTRALRALDRQFRASRTRLRYRVLRHPLRLAYPTPSRLQKWKQHGFSLQVKARTPWGQRIVVTLPDDVSISLRWNGFFEYDLSVFYLRHLQRDMTFIDVGAHVGYFSMLASRAVGPAGRVFAFEPTPSTFSVLTMNAGTEPNITPINKAVWSEASVIDLHDYGPCFSAFNSAFRARLPESVRADLTERTYSVPAVRLDDFVRDQGCIPDVVKIDVESAEMHVLRGMKDMLSGPRPIVSLEVGDMDVPGAARSRLLVEHIMSFGYRAFELHNGRAAPHQLREEYGYENIVFAPSERADQL
ncbi:FkbM family methyltransferase [Streptomyces sp. RB6PN25]|uniref:FkbM family methyltransferase n=1 Tax=Streptomyces humicola TaxID=2953240 RepID=A0ABT1PPT6_9ACTN|nr:FkbM family methyltransferase [Streptomyces humicola]MCQ4079692.1 FkbM family methyltransferase [Streptomyces humicola]